MVLVTSNLSAQDAFIPFYNATANTFSVQINPCDPCILGGEQYVPFCKCAQKASDYCDHLLTQPNSAAYYQWCKHDYYTKTCGEYPQSPQVISSYNGGMTISYGTFDQPKSQYKSVFMPFNYNGPSLLLPNWNPSGPNFPNLAAGYNYCIYVHIAIFFKNGKTCHFKKEVCVING